jgi:GntR family transcriptional regulator
MHGVDRSSPVPLWAQLLADLRRRLDAGEFTDRFPTDNELIDEYELSRHTVRDAVRRLQDEGVVSRERGRGTFVTAPAVEQPWGGGIIYSLFRSVEAQGFEQRSKVLDLSETTDAEAAGRLAVRANAKLVRLERLRLVDGHPLAHDVAWLPAVVARPLLGVDFTHTALYDELAGRCGVHLTEGTERVFAVVPDDHQRDLLGLAARQAAFRLERLSQAGETTVEWRRTVVRGDRYSFVASWSQSPGDRAPTSPPDDVLVS